MAARSEQVDNCAFNPLDAVEEVLSLENWDFARPSDEEIAVQAPGLWCDFSLFFSWSEELRVLNFSCALDLHVNPESMQSVFELVAKFNARLWIGHFSIWIDEGFVMFKHTVRCDGGRIDIEQIRYLVGLARSECDRYYPAFRFLLLDGKLPDDAIALSLLETEGRA
ncbi:MAG: hypothetical protein CMM25_06760 [Rhodospirillaceae bacterium]|nr:hypothetical protein [Rhodospirillaceae bacterium]